MTQVWEQSPVSWGIAGSFSACLCPSENYQSIIHSGSQLHHNAVLRVGMVVGGRMYWLQQSFLPPTQKTGLLEKNKQGGCQNNTCHLDSSYFHAGYAHTGPLGRAQSVISAAATTALCPVKLWITVPNSHHVPPRQGKCVWHTEDPAALCLPSWSLTYMFKESDLELGDEVLRKEKVRFLKKMKVIKEPLRSDRWHRARDGEEDDGTMLWVSPVRVNGCWLRAYLSHYEPIWLSEIGIQGCSTQDDKDELGLLCPSPQSASGGHLSWKS